MRVDDYIIDSHRFGGPICFDEVVNKSIWCFAKESKDDNDYFYIYHDLTDDSMYTRISMNSSDYIYDDSMRKLTDDEKVWLVNILSTKVNCLDGEISNWEKMVNMYADECTAYGINISRDIVMPDYTKLSYQV